VSTSDAVAATVRRAEAAELAAEVAGPVFLPGDAGFAAECARYQLTRVLEPALVAGVASPAEVQAAVRFAARRGLPVAVHHTGHQVVRAAHGAVLISTRRMNGVAINPRRRTARIGPGVRWGQVINQASAFGLAPMNGSSPVVGAIGYSLGGGQSLAWSRSKGYAADHILSLEAVTADGRLRHVTAMSDPELFWALRGGKGNFGVVTAMVAELFAQTRFYGGGVWFALEHVPAVLPAWRDWLETLPEEASTSIAVQRLPALPDLPPPVRGAAVLHLRFTHLGSAAGGERLFAPIRALAPALVDTVVELPYTSIGLVHLDPPEPLPYWDRTLMLADLPTAAVDALVALTGPDSACPLSSVEIRQLGGAMDREPSVANAIPTRGLPFVLFAAGMGGPDQEDLVRGNLATLIRGLEPWSSDRQMVNFLSADEATTPEQLRAVYGEERYDRLAQVKRTYDPLNLFRMNHNIVPA
jgi:FAD/FMN-containing dehydrogenase